MSRDTAELRAFLAGLTGTGPRASRSPPALYRIASSVVRRGREDAGDLVSEVVLDLLERNGQAGGVEHLLLLDDAALVRAIVRRATQLRATMLGNRWQLVKTVRAHVRAALSTLSTPRPTNFPLSVMTGERISSARVAESVSWYRKQPGNEGADAKEISSWLLATYFAGPTADDLYPTDSGAGHEQVEDQLDGAVVARQLSELLGSELMEIIMPRASGEPLSAIAARTGCATSTVHSRVRAAGQRLATTAADLGWSRGAVQMALASSGGLRSHPGGFSPPPPLP